METYINTIWFWDDVELFPFNKSFRDVLLLFIIWKKDINTFREHFAFSSSNLNNTVCNICDDTIHSIEI